MIKYRTRIKPRMDKKKGRIFFKTKQPLWGISLAHKRHQKTRGLCGELQCAGGWHVCLPSRKAGLAWHRLRRSLLASGWGSQPRQPVWVFGPAVVGDEYLKKGGSYWTKNTLVYWFTKGKSWQISRSGEPWGPPRLGCSLSGPGS